MEFNFTGCILIVCYPFRECSGKQKDSTVLSAVKKNADIVVYYKIQK
jgi:hypothetical protein